ncbi:MAG: hypothetical protein ACXAE3_04405, partial [Candidatus Kariarchaeaceae archaeon]
INFSAFAETGSIILPFLLNGVYNIGITIVQAGNALLFDEVNPMMFIPYVVILLIILVWYFVKTSDFSTIRIGLSRLTDLRKMNLAVLLSYVVLFVVLSFIIPAIVNDLLFLRTAPDVEMSWIVNIFFVETATGPVLSNSVIPILYAINFILLIIMATVVLTYEPTQVFDVLLVGNDGTPLASHIEIFETDDVLISGFFTALSAVDEELSSDGGLRSVKRGEREILIEEGVFTRIIALADKDQSSIRQSITMKHREFEIANHDLLEKKTGYDFPEAKQLVQELGDLEVTFNVPDQTRWIASISLALAPVMIALIGLL